MDKAATDLGAPIDKVCKDIAMEKHVYAPFGEPIKLSERYRNHVPYCVHNVVTATFPFSLSKGRKNWVPTLRDYDLTSGDIKLILL